MLEGNRLPVKLHQKGGLLVAAIPMPGLEPQDISVSIEANNILRVRGAQRDTGANDKDGAIMQEWQIGPYERDIQLPSAVDGTSANVTFNNGVLVVSMPQSDTTRPANLKLERLDSTSGIRYGHTDSGSLPANQ
jgi:HSP20 family molecular chaperone IbpA